MSQTLPPLKAMQAFEATARLRSFSKAASELCVSQSAISHQIKSLEMALGRTLLHRQGKPLQLTEAGATLYSVLGIVFSGCIRSVSTCGKVKPRRCASWRKLRLQLNGWHRGCRCFSRPIQK